MKHTPTKAEKESVLDAVYNPLDTSPSPMVQTIKMRLEALRDKWMEVDEECEENLKTDTDPSIITIINPSELVYMVKCAMSDNCNAYYESQREIKGSRRDPVGCQAKADLRSRKPSQ